MRLRKASRVRYLPRRVPWRGPMGSQTGPWVGAEGAAGLGSVFMYVGCEKDAHLQQVKVVALFTSSPAHTRHEF